MNRNRAPLLLLSLFVTTGLNTVAIAHEEKGLVCKTALGTSDLSLDEAKKYSVKELLPNSSALLKIQGVREPRQMNCSLVPHSSDSSPDHYKLDAICEDTIRNGYKMEIKSAMSSGNVKSIYALIRLKSNNKLVSRLSCEKPLLSRVRSSRVRD